MDKLRKANGNRESATNTGGSFREKPDLPTPNPILTLVICIERGIYIGSTSVLLEISKSFPDIHQKISQGFEAYHLNRITQYQP
jgi:hypothetical protein